jgi:hypothetical protein
MTAFGAAGATGIHQQIVRKPHSYNDFQPAGTLMVKEARRLMWRAFFLLIKDRHNEWVRGVTTRRAKPEKQ